MVRNIVERALPPVLFVVIGVWMIQPELGEVLAGEPISPRAPNITFGILLWVAYFGPSLAAHIESDRTNSNRVDLSDRAFLLGFGSWIIAGVAFVIAGLGSLLVAGFTVFGLVAVVAWVYDRHTRSSG
jgi:hypothetical protein